MAAEIVKRMVHYRRAQFSGDVHQNLQQLVSASIGKQSKIKDRFEPTNPEASEFRFISHHTTKDHFICGRLTTFERGSYQMVIDDNPDAAILPLSKLAPPKSTDGVQQQFVPGILYFAIHKNHVAVCQTQSLKTNALEAHLVWLLRSKTGLLTTLQGFVLKDEPQKATREKIRKSHVKSVMIGRPLLDEEAFVMKGKKSSKFKPTGNVVRILKELVAPEHFEKLGLKDQVFDGNLEVWIEIRYPKHARVRPADSVRLLDNIGIAFRDIDEEQSKLLLADGGVVHGKELRISSALEVESNDGSISETKLYDEMRAWVWGLLKDGMITVD